jgi:hypothetical protein
MYLGHVRCFPYKFAGTLALIPSAEGGYTISVALWYKQGTFMTNLVSHSNYNVQQLFQATTGILTAVCFNIMGFWNITQYILMDKPSVSEKNLFLQLRPEDRGSMFFRNVGNHLQD